MAFGICGCDSNRFGLCSQWSPIISGLRKAINTFDAVGPNIICGCDNEAVYLVENVY